MDKKTNTGGWNNDKILNNMDIVIDYGRKELGGENQLYFVIRLGREVGRQNC